MIWRWDDMRNGSCGSIDIARNKIVRMAMVVVSLLFAGSLGAAERLFELKKVADDVYIGLALLKNGVISNAGIVILDDGVLIVDTHSRPSTARSLIEQIKGITDKPVRYVVNTHFHADHFRGNAAYLQAYPKGVNIISSAAARRGILQRGIPRINVELNRLPKRIETLQRELAAASAERQTELKRRLANSETYLEELKQMGNAVPTMTLEKSLVLHRKGRTVQILFMGKGHTDGDVVVYLPKEKILMSGDLIHAWVPYLADSYPFEWIRTLEAVERLDFNIIISGHGDVMHGKEMVTIYHDYLQDLMTQTADLHGKGFSHQQIRQNIHLDKYQPLLGLDEAGTGLAEALDSHVAKAYRVITGSQ